jgi:hypothetical protein
VRQLAWVDFDGDGDLDLFVAFRDRPNALFRQRQGPLPDVAGALGLAEDRRSVGAVWFDYNRDGRLDVYVGNMDGDPNGLYENGAITVRESREPCSESSGAAAQPARAGARHGAPLRRGRGRRRPPRSLHGQLRPQRALPRPGQRDSSRTPARRGASRSTGVTTPARSPTSTTTGLDLYVNGTFTGGVQHPGLPVPQHRLRFEDVTPPNVRALNASHGALWADFDGDGALDLALAGARD